MHTFNAPRFYYVTTLLAGVETTVTMLKWVADTEGKGPIKVNYEYSVLEPDIDALVTQFRELGLEDCAIELTRAKHELKRQLTGESGDAAQYLSSFRRRVHDALKAP